MFYFLMNTGTMPAITQPEYRENVGNNSGRISAQNSGGIPGGMLAIIPVEFQPRFPVEYQGECLQ